MIEYEGGEPRSKDGKLLSECPPGTPPANVIFHPCPRCSLRFSVREVHDDHLWWHPEEHAQR